MTQECTLKEMFIIKQLDKLQPNWREGADVTMATKKAIQAYISDHYSDLGEIYDNPECITIRTIEHRLTDIRTKLGIPSRMDSIKKSHTPVRAGETDLDSCECDTDTPRDESETVPDNEVGSGACQEEESEEPVRVAQDTPATTQAQDTQPQHQEACTGDVCPVPTTPQAEISEPAKPSDQGVLNRPSMTQPQTIPAGFYYYSQAGCGSCYSKEGLEELFDYIGRMGGVEMPQLFYIDMGSEGFKNPLNIVHPLDERTTLTLKLTTSVTPTVCEIGARGIYLSILFDEPAWIVWHFGEDVGGKIVWGMRKAREKAREEDFKEKIRLGWDDEKLLHHFHYIRPIVAKWREDVRNEKAGNAG